MVDVPILPWAHADVADGDSIRFDAQTGVFKPEEAPPPQVLGAVPDLPVVNWSLPGFPHTGTAAEGCEANRLYLSPFVVRTPRVLTGVMIQVDTAFGADGEAALGVYRYSGAGHEWTLELDAGTVLVSTTGAKSVPTEQLLEPGLYALGSVYPDGTGKVTCWTCGGGIYGTQGPTMSGNKYTHYAADTTGILLPPSVTGRGLGGYASSFTRGAVRLQP